MKLKINKSSYINFSYINSIYAYFFIAAFLVLINPFNDTDTFWHLKAGEYMVNNLTVPTTDIYSWYGVANNLEWITHEWLSEVCFYIINLVFGNTGLVLISTALVVGLLYFIFKTNESDFKRNNLFGFLAITLFIVNIKGFAVIRPQIFSYLFMAYLIYVLEKYIKSETKLIWTLPLLMFLWVNFHGGSAFLFYVIPLIYIISGLINFKWSRFYGEKIAKSKIKNILLILFSGFIVSFLNPSGYKIILYPIINIGDSLLMNTIMEWFPSVITSTIGFLFFLTLFLVIFIFITTNKDINIKDMLLAVAFTYLALKSVRFIALFTIITVPIMVKYVSSFMDDKKFIVSMPHWCKICIVASISILSTILIFVQAATAQSKESYYPTEKTLSIIKELNPQRIYNDYGWGGYLIYKEMPVFIDGRADVYAKHTFKDARDIHVLSESTNELLEKYNFDVFLISKDGVLATYLREKPNYEVVYEDDISIVIKKITNS